MFLRFSSKTSLGIITLIISLFGFISSCSMNNRGDFYNENKNKKIVLTTFTVLEDMAKNVAGNRFIIKSITKKGVEIHGYQPTPSDLVRASKADLIIQNGLGLELWSKKFLMNLGDVPSVVLSEGIQPLFIEGDAYAGKPNPHVWMSPKRAIKYVDKLVESFTNLDPLGAKEFEDNGRNYKEKLLKLDKELRSSLALIPYKKRVLVSCEGALSYLAKDYGMEEAYLWPVNAESQVTPKRMLRLIQTVKEKAIPAVFCESTVNSKAQQEVARASGAKFGGTFYVDSLSDESGPAPTLIDLQKHNVKLIIQGLTNPSKEAKN